MKHSFDELFHVRNISGIFSEKAVEGLERLESFRDFNESYWECQSLCAAPTDKIFRIYDTLGSRKKYHLGYAYGTYLWFDTEEELNAYRSAINEERRINRVEKAKKALAENIITLLTDGDCTKEEIKTILDSFLKNA